MQSVVVCGVTVFVLHYIPLLNLCIELFDLLHFLILLLIKDWVLHASSDVPKF
jgi:hypothetical protein